MPKITVNLPEDVIGAVERLAREENVSKTEALRRCVSIAVFFHDEVAGGSRLLVERQGQKTRELILRP